MYRRVIFTIPAALHLIAKQISRSFDPDIGGYDGFSTGLSADGSEPITHYGYACYCTDSFTDAIPAMIADPSILKASIDTDYEARWPEFTAPTLEECTAFAENLQVFTDTERETALAEINLMQIIVNLEGNYA